MAKVNNIVYDIETRQFVAKVNGQQFTDEAFERFAGTRASRENSTGSTTLKKAALANTILAESSEGQRRVVAGLIKLAGEPSLLN